MFFVDPGLIDTPGANRRGPLSIEGFIHSRLRFFFPSWSVAGLARVEKFRRRRRDGGRGGELPGRRAGWQAHRGFAQMGQATAARGVCKCERARVCAAKLQKANMHSGYQTKVNILGYFARGW